MGSRAACSQKPGCAERIMRSPLPTREWQWRAVHAVAPLAASQNSERCAGNGSPSPSLPSTSPVATVCSIFMASELRAAHGVGDLRTDRTAIGIERRPRAAGRTLAGPACPACSSQPSPPGRRLRPYMAAATSLPCVRWVLMIHLHHGDGMELLKKRTCSRGAKTSGPPPLGTGKTCPSSRRCGSSAS